MEPQLLFLVLPQVTLDCPSSEDIPRVDKLVEKILHCSCQACGKEQSQEGALFNVYLNADENLPAEAPNPHPFSHHPEDMASSRHHRQHVEELEN